MIIRFCLSLSQKSVSSSDGSRDTSDGVIKLPSCRTFRDYKNWIRPRPGFSEGVVEELVRLSAKYFDIERYVVLLLDEIKIKSNLVFDKHSREPIGFVDLGSDECNFACLEKADEPATHTLAFIVRGLCTDLKFCLYRTSVTASQMMPIFWKQLVSWN
eukprot:gene4055-biopygen11871